MSKPEILLAGAYPDWDMEDLNTQYQVHRYWEIADKAAFLATRGPSIRAIATRGELGASAELMVALPALEIVSCYGVGTDAINLAYARDHKIRVTNTPDVLNDDVADIAIALLLATARQVPQGDHFVRSGQWGKVPMPLVTRVSGKRLGIVGMGRIGQAIAQRAAGFGCTISYFARTERPSLNYTFVADLLDLAAQSDFLIVIVPGGEATKNIINAEVLRALGPDGMIVNVSRGTTMDETALIEALQKRTIKAAGLDVFWNEPNINPAFFGLDNVVLHPHHGSGTVETRKAMGQLVRDNLAAHFAGLSLLTPVL
jgi:lactate dehydrogenase-like 2-hydroxyacid dehydrogenase